MNVRAIREQAISILKYLGEEDGNNKRNLILNCMASIIKSELARSQNKDATSNISDFLCHLIKEDLVKPLEIFHWEEQGTFLSQLISKLKAKDIYLQEENEEDAHRLFYKKKKIFNDLIIAIDKKATPVELAPYFSTHIYELHECTDGVFPNTAALEENKIYIAKQQGAWRYVLRDPVGHRQEGTIETTIRDKSPSLITVLQSTTKNRHTPIFAFKRNEKNDQLELTHNWEARQEKQREKNAEKDALLQEIDLQIKKLEQRSNFCFISDRNKMINSSKVAILKDLRMVLSSSKLSYQEVAEKMEGLLKYKKIIDDFYCGYIGKFFAQGSHTATRILLEKVSKFIVIDMGDENCQRLGLHPRGKTMKGG